MLAAECVRFGRIIAVATFGLFMSMASAKEISPNTQMSEERIIELKWDRAVANLEAILSDPSSGGVIRNLADRIGLVEQRLSFDRQKSQAAYVTILKKRLDEIQVEKGGAVIGDPRLYDAMVNSLAREENIIKNELHKLNDE